MNLQQILSDASVSAFRSLVAMASGVIVVPIITNLLGADAFGIWKTVLAFVAITSLVGGLHLQGSLIRYTQKENESQVFIDILTITAFLGTSLTIVISGSGLIIYELGKIEFLPVKLILPIGILVGLYPVNRVLHNYLRAQKRVKSFELITIARNLIEAIALVIVFWYTKSLAAGLWAIIVVMVAFNISLMLMFLPRPLTTPEPSNFRTYLEYGIPMVPKEVAGKLLRDGDKFLIIFFLGPALTGFYAVAYIVASVIQNGATVFNSTLYPNVTSSWDNGEFAQLSSFYTKFLRWYLVLVLPAIVGLILLGDSIINLVSTPEVVRETTWIIPLLAFGFAFQGFQGPLSYILAAAERTRLIAYITLLAVVMNLGLNIILIPLFGLPGAAFATMLSYGLRTGLLFSFSTTYIDIEIPVEYIVKSIVATMIMASVLVILPINTGIYKVITYPIIGSSIFVIIIVKIGGISKQEKDYLHSKLERYIF